jgi:hypothetical protein
MGGRGVYKFFDGEKLGKKIKPKGIKITGRFLTQLTMVELIWKSMKVKDKERTTVVKTADYPPFYIAITTVYLPKKMHASIHYTVARKVKTKLGYIPKQIYMRTEDTTQYPKVLLQWLANKRKTKMRELETIVIERSIAGLDNIDFFQM